MCSGAATASAVVAAGTVVPALAAAQLAGP